MILGCQDRAIEVLVHFHGRGPLEVRLHAPNKCDGSSYLDVTRNTCHSVDLAVGEDVLRLDEVCGIAFVVQTSYDESPAGSSVIFPGNEVEVSLLADLDRGLGDEYVAENARNPEWRILNSLKLLQ